MNIKLKLLSLALILTCFTHAQEKTLVVSGKRNNDQTVSFSFKKTKYGNYYLDVWFTELSNSVSRGYQGVVNSPGGQLFNLKPNSENIGISYSYRYSYVRGLPNPKIDPEFIYMFPLGVAKQVEPRKMFNLESRYFNANDPENFIAFLFRVQPEDTVFAARKGLVVEVDNTYDYDTAHIVSYQSSINKVTVEHPDGTLAVYKGFQKDKIFVEEGQIIYPRAPLGKIGIYDKKGEGQLRFQIYYLNDIRHLGAKMTNYKNKINRYAYVDPLFLTEEGGTKLENMKSYKVFVDDMLVSKELTKRERKRRLREKK